MKKITLILSLAIALASCGNEKSEKETSASDTAVLTIPSSSKEDARQQIEDMASAAQNANIEVRTFQGEGGWGYDIYMNEKMYVHQPHIPAVSGNRAFKSEADARKTGDLAAYKIKNNILPPSITVEELDSLGVLK